jgi:hypothetical protein
MCVAVAAKTQVFNFAGYTTGRKLYSATGSVLCQKKAMIRAKVTKDDGHGKAP